MIIDFGANVVVTQTWTELKAIVQAKALQLQYADDAEIYTPFAIDAGIVYRATIFKGTVPAVNDWDQSTNDAWETDFVTNFLPTANARIKDAVDTSGTSTVSGEVSSDMRVGGSAVSNANPVPMSDGGGSISVDGTFWQATQPVSAASLPLPTGAATETTLAAVSGKLPATLGQKTNGNSLAVTIASDQTAIPVSDGGGSLTIDATALPLPTGAATSALQTAGNSSLSSIDGKTPALGQAAMAASAPVVIASNQSTVPVSIASSVPVTGPLTDAQLRATPVPVSATTLPLPTGAATETTLSAINTKTPALGQTTMASSTPVTIASNQTALPVTDNGGSLTIDGTVAATQSGTWNIANVSGTVSLPTGASTAALQTTGNTSLSSIDTKTPALGQTVMASSTPVVIASNQTGVPVVDGGGSLTVDGTVTANAGTGVWDVTPASPVATDYLPVRLTDGSAFYTASGGGGGGASDLATFVAYANDIATANNKSMFSIVNTAAVVVKIQSIKFVNVRNATATGVSCSFQTKRCTGHSGGTTWTPDAHDTSDTINAGVTVRTNATVSGAAATYLSRWEYSTDEWGPGALDVEAHDHALQRLIPVYEHKSPAKAITLRQNQGLTINCATNTTTGIFDVEVVFTQE